MNAQCACDRYVKGIILYRNSYMLTISLMTREVQQTVKYDKFKADFPSKMCKTKSLNVDVFMLDIGGEPLTATETVM